MQFTDKEIQLMQNYKKLQEENELLAAALAAKDEALSLARKEFDGLPHSLGYEFTHTPKIDEALALQPHASILNKIRADAIKTAVSSYSHHISAEGKRLIGIYTEAIEQESKR